MSSLAYERLHENLKTLGLETTSGILDGYLETATKQDKSIVEILDYLMNQEAETKINKSIGFRSRIAKFPYKKTLQEFDFAFQPSVDKKMINNLAGMKFIHNFENVVFLGPPGVGKTHLSIAIGLEAIRAGFTVCFTTASDLVEDLRQHHRQGLLKRRLSKIARFRLLIVDEIGYLPMSREDANLLFQLVSQRYERSSMIMTSNKPFREWGGIFSDEVVAAAILDRLLHHCTVVNIKGDSYRIKERKRAGLPKPYMQEQPATE